jgi:hypothetical protein
MWIELTGMRKWLCVAMWSPSYLKDSEKHLK